MVNNTFIITKIFFKFFISKNLYFTKFIIFIIFKYIYNIYLYSFYIGLILSFILFFKYKELISFNIKEFF